MPDREELRKLLVPALILVAALAAGALLIWQAERALGQASARVAVIKADRTQKREKLARISEEEREVKEKLEIYSRLKAARIIGEERRLEWADTVARIREQRELPDLRYRVERQRLIHSVQGKPAPVDFFASNMLVDLSLLHEGDLLAFLRDLRESGNAYYSVQRCAMERTGQPASAPTLVPRLRASCSNDLITILDRAAVARR
jgi:hypothetical protein